jgi:hypothetical protein
MHIFQLQTILQQGYTPYGPPPPFPCPTTPGDPSIPHAESSQVNLSFPLNSQSRLLNMTQSLLCYRVFRVARHPRCRGEDLPLLVDLSHGHHRCGRLLATFRYRLLAPSPHTRIQVSLLALLPHNWDRVTGCH